MNIWYPQKYFNFARDDRTADLEELKRVERDQIGFEWSETRVIQPRIANWSSFGCSEKVVTHEGLHVNSFNMILITKLVKIFIWFVNIIDRILQLFGITLYPLTRENVLKGKLIY